MGEDFFADPNTQTTPSDNQSQVFTIGDKQYTQDQLDELVSLGEMSREAQIRYNTDLSKVYPEYIKTTQRVKELEEQQAQYERQQQDLKFSQGQQLTPDEVRERAQEEATNLGLWNDKNAPERLNEVLDGRDLAAETDEIVDDLSTMGIETDRETILDYMDQNDISLPERAADEMYDYLTRLRDTQAQEMESLKEGEDLFTFSGEETANRLPEGVKINDDNFKQILGELIGE